MSVDPATADGGVEPIVDAALFRLLVERIVDYAIFLLTPDGRVASWNSGAERLKQYAADEIIGQSFERFYPPEARAVRRPASLLAEALAKGRVEDEGWRVRKDGTHFWANVVITALRDDYGQLLGFAKVTRDLTSRRAAEEQLRQSEQRFHTLVANVTDYAIFMLSPEGLVETWNAGAERLKLYTADEICGRSFETFYTAADRAAGRPARLLREAQLNGRVEDEGWRVRKDGSLFWADVVITALTSDDGTLTGFAKVTRDLTLRRQAEADRAQRQAAERAADRLQRLQAATVKLAAATSAQGAAELLAEATSASMRAAACRVVLTEPYGEVDDVVSDAEGAPLSTHTAIIDEQSATVPLRVEGRHLGALCVQFDQPRVLDADERGLLLALAESGAQAIDRARLYESELAARAEAEAAVRAQEEFLSIAAHELRTPVAAIKATAQLAHRSIVRGPLDSDRVTRHLDSIAHASDRLGALIEDLLDVSRLQTGSLKIRKQHLDLRPLVHDVVDRYAGTADAHQFNLEMPGQDVVVNADPLRVEQVLDNVLSNAVKYSPDGGGIDVVVQADADHVTLTVTDHGIGLPPGQEERIFDVFGRGSNVKAYQIQGLGLGLAICRQLVELHHGRIWAANAENGGGTVIGIQLPLSKDTL